MYASATRILSYIGTLTTWHPRTHCMPCSLPRPPSRSSAQDSIPSPWMALALRGPATAFPALKSEGLFLGEYRGLNT